MDKRTALIEWLKIEYYYMAKRVGFINKIVYPTRELILDTIRVIDYETTMVNPVDTNVIITLLALMWEHVDKENYDIKDFVLKALSRIGYPTSAYIADKGFDSALIQFSAPNSIFDKYTLTLLQSKNEVYIGRKKFLLTEFQKQLWDALSTQQLLGVSAPTSAGKSFVLLIKTVEKMLREPLDVIYIVPTLSLLNQVTEDYNSILKQVGVESYLITNNLTIGESRAAHTIYVWTQEKAIASLSSENLKKMPQKTILIVDEIQNIERISEDTDVRSKILFDTIQELRHLENVQQIIISGPRINRISELGKLLFGNDTEEVSTFCSPVLNLTYSVKRKDNKYYLKQYCGLLDSPYEEEIENSDFIAGYGESGISTEYTNYLCTVIRNLCCDQNIIFAPTSTAARNIAISLAHKSPAIFKDEIDELVSYYSQSVNENYSLCETLKKGFAYHHGKIPIHVRRTLEKAMRLKLVSNVVCTTTLMQGVNLPAQNVIIRNPHLYIRHYPDEAELTSYEMANLRGRAGRLLKDFVGRTIVLDEGEFEGTEGYNQQALFEDVSKEVYPGYGDLFEEFKDQIIDTLSDDKCVDGSMQRYGFLVTYVRQSVLRYGRGAKQRMAETGLKLTSKQVAAIIQKLNALSIPKKICLDNRYWDPFVLNDIYLKFKGKVPNIPTERGARARLSDILKFLRDNESTAKVYERYIPARFRSGTMRGLLCSTSIKWSSEKPLCELLSGNYYTGENAPDHIEETIKLLQDTISFNVPLLIKPVIEMRNGNSAMVACLQAGAYKRGTRKMIEIGIPRELAIKLNSLLFPTDIDGDIGTYDFELLVREKIKEAFPALSYWERVQLEYLL